MEVEIGDSDEEVGGGRRRLGRIAKSRERVKQLACCSQEDEETDTNSEESDKNSRDGQEKGNDKTEKEVEKWNDTLDGTWDFVANNPIKDPSLDPTHVSATITQPPINNQENSKIVIDSPNTISSSAKNVGLVNLKAPTDNLIMQDSNRTMVNSKALKLGVEEKGEVTRKDLWELKNRCNAVEEGFSLFSKFTLKVTHAAATTLQLLVDASEEDNLGKEDSKLLYGFLAEDWARKKKDVK